MYLRPKPGPTLYYKDLPSYPRDYVPLGETQHEREEQANPAISVDLQSHVGTLVSCPHTPEGDSITALVATGATSGAESSSNSFSSKRNDPRGGSISSPPNGSPNGPPNGRQGRGGQDRTSANSSGGSASPAGRGRVHGGGQDSRRDTANSRSKVNV